MNISGEGREAGASILKDIDVFNKAYRYMEERIQSEIQQQILTIIYKLRDKNEFLPFPKDNYYYFFPSDWKVTEEKSAKSYAYFEILEDDDGDSLQIANLCGVGTGSFKLRFAPETKLLGGHKEWRKFICEEIFADLTRRASVVGFTPESNGMLSIRIVVNPETLASAWASRDYAAALQPFTDALEKFKEGLPIFDEIVSQARKAAGGEGTSTQRASPQPDDTGSVEDDMNVRSFDSGHSPTSSG